MNSAIAYLAIFFAAIVLISLFYWHVVHTTMLTRLRFQLFARRDHLRNLAIIGEESPASFAYQEVESFICKTIGVVPSVSLASFVCFYFRSDGVETETEKRFDAEASNVLKKIISDTTEDALRIMMINSPILLAASFAVYFTLWLFGREDSDKIYRNAETFVDELPGGHMPLTV